MQQAHHTGFSFKRTGFDDWTAKHFDQSTADRVNDHTKQNSLKGTGKKVRKAGIIRFLPLVAAASIVVVVAIGLGLRSRWSKAGDELYVCYSYGEKSTDSQQVMSTVESSLADFFGDTSPAEANLFEMFER